MRRLTALALALLLLVPSAFGEAGGVPEITGSMDVRYASQFAVDYCADGSALVTVAGSDRFLLLPDGADAQAGLSADVAVVRVPIKRAYVAASSVMDLFRQLDALDQAALTSTKAENWSVPEIAEAVSGGRIRYAGKYSLPDFEAVCDADCDIAIESTMIWHSPDIKEQLEELDIPVLVERSSYESHPLGRLEWIRLYGLLTGRQERADEWFAACEREVERIGESGPTGRTCAYFYVNTSGAAVVRKPGDYISRMIEMAGGEYALNALLPEEENAVSTMKLTMEDFYMAAKDADVLVYDSAIMGNLGSVEELIARSPVFADFKAVREGRVWQVSRDMFQQSSGAADMIADFHRAFTDADEADMVFLSKLN